MNLLWLTWKDFGHPAAGGAEVVLWELSRRMVREGHAVTLLTCGYTGADKHERREGIDIIRIGKNRYLHSLQALIYYMRYLRGAFDMVIEVVNTAPYFSVFFGKGSQRYLFYHQLAREVWFYETKPPLSHFGYYVLEPLATRLLSRSSAPVITVSESTRNDLGRYGFKAGRTHVISEGIQLKPSPSLAHVPKFREPTMLSLGALRAMKRTREQVAAFELAKEHIPDLQLKIAGLANDAYGDDVLEYIKRSPHAADIEYLGKVSDAEKKTLMQRSHLISVTSVKEGWGLIITEAASQGTPAVVYDADGLRDSVRHGKTGIVTKPTPQALAEGITTLLTDKKYYEQLRRAAWQWSKKMTFDNSYQDLKHVLEVS